MMPVNRLVDSYIDGVELLGAFFEKQEGLGEFVIYRQADLSKKLKKISLDTSDTDLFYVRLNALLFEDPAESNKSFIVKLLDAIRLKAGKTKPKGPVKHIPKQTKDFANRLTQSVKHFESKSVDELKEMLNAFFLVKDVSLDTFFEGSYQSLNKINHGYWEYVRLAYGGTNASEKMRQSKSTNKFVVRLSKSGVTAFRCWQLSQYDFEKNFLAISLNNGTAPYNENLSKPFNTVKHGASVGILSVFAAARGMKKPDKPITLYDGCITRKLIFDESLLRLSHDLSERFNSCIFMVPGHLSGIKMRGFEGNQHEFIVPGMRVNESFLGVTATFLGFLRQVIAQEDGKVVVLAQAASIATLIGMVIDSDPQFPKEKVTLLDLGRVLDLAVPETFMKQRWAAGEHSDKVDRMIKSRVFSIDKN